MNNSSDEHRRTTFFLVGIVGYAYYYLGHSFYNMRIQNRITAAYEFRKSWKYFEEAMEVIKMHEENSYIVDQRIKGLVNFGMTWLYTKHRTHDILGHGLFHFVISLIPPALRTLATIIGFEASREVCLNLLFH